MAALKQAIGSVVASMAGMPAETADTRDIPLFESPVMNVRIAFTGPYSGELGLMMEQPLAELVGTKMLGFSPGEHLIHDTVDDAAKELLNVICGQFITSMFGSRPVFSLNVPQIFPLNPSVCNALVQISSVIPFRVQGHTLLGTVRVKKSGQ